MLDIAPGMAVWRNGLGATRGLAGALVRVRPPADVSGEHVERLRGLLVEGGAAAVKILPPAAGSAAAPQEVEAAPPAAGIREVVTACAERSRSKDARRRDAVLDEALSAEGL